MKKINEMFGRSNLEIVNNVKVTYDLCLSGVITRSNESELFNMIQFGIIE